MSEALAEGLEDRPRRFRPYPKYKDSGVDWLTRMPSHWECSRVRFLVALNPSRTEIGGLDPELDVSFVPMEALGENGSIDLENIKSLSQFVEGYTYFHEGDVVVAKITPCFENGKGALAIGLVNEIAFGTTELHVLRPSGYLNPHFLLYVTLSDHFRRLGTAEMYGAGGQKRVPASFIQNLSHPLPSPSDQKAIASFLDGETAEIDVLIAKKERLIELLQEKRTALVTRAATKGLDSNAPMKGSGVEWLGEIPTHWSIKRLAHLTPTDRRIMYGIVLPGPNVDEGVPIVKGGDVSAARLKVENLSRTSYEIEAGYVRSRLRGGDLVYAIRGSIGEVEMVPEEVAGANITQDAARVSYTAEVHGRWLLYALRSRAAFSQLEAGALGATIKGINIRDLKRAVIPVPPKTEQMEIASFLDAETARIGDLIRRIEDGIARLNEFRAALISAAVTGKIDVREEVA